MNVTHAAMIGLGLSLAGCQIARSPELAPAPGKSIGGGADRAAEATARRRSAERVGVDVRVTRLGTGETVATARGDLEANRTTEFETSEVGKPQRSKLRLNVEPRGKDAYAVEISWEEQTPEGRQVSWRPTVAVVGGAEHVSEIAWADGDGRRITLTLTAPEAGRHATAASREAASATAAAAPAEAPAEGALVE